MNKVRDKVEEHRFQSSTGLGSVSSPPLTGDLARVADPFCLSVLICELGLTACFPQWFIHAGSHGGQVQVSASNHIGVSCSCKLLRVQHFEDGSPPGRNSGVAIVWLHDSGILSLEHMGEPQWSLSTTPRVTHCCALLRIGLATERTQAGAGGAP